MPYALSKFEVEDFAKWKAEFGREEAVALRKGGGMKSYRLFHVEGDPNSLVMLCEFDDLEAARKFMQSEELREAHKKSGAIGKPAACFLEEVEKRAV